MSTMTTALARSGSVITAAYETALSMKAAGMLPDMAPQSGLAQFGAFRDDVQNKQRYSLFRGWLYSAINALASEAAGQPVVVASLKGKVKAPTGKKSIRNKMTTTARVKAAQQDFEVLVDHPLLDLLETPNPIQNRWQFVYSFVANLNLTGWSYIIGGENEEGEYEFYSLPTTWIKPDHRDGPFSRFKVVDPANPKAGGDEDEWLTRENVAFAMLPNPADPRMAMAPVQSQNPAVRIDDFIQTSQMQFFDNGIFPSAIVTIGKDPHPDVPGGIRPRLTAAQRRQVTGAIRKVMAGVANYGNPAIVDGMIESIERLTMTSNEMGWDKSEDKNRTRILSAFGVHPYILGEPVGVGGYAQVANIEKRFYKRVNTFLDMLGTVVTNFVGSAVSENAENLFVWWEECQSVDPQLRWSNLNAARTRGDISRNEIRTELGLPPDETGGEATKNYAATDVTAIVAVQAAVASGGISPEQAAALYVLAFDMAPEDAKKIAGPKPKPQPVAPGGVPGIPGQPGKPEGKPGAFGKPAGGASADEEEVPPTEEEAMSKATKSLELAVATFGLQTYKGSLPSSIVDRLLEVVGEES